MERRSPRQRKHSNSSSSSSASSTPPTRASYYAGARFETTPTLSSLPAPPVRWTMSSPLFRSKSTPSSPITTNMMGTEKRQPMTAPVTPTVFKSASFPGDSSLMSLFRVRVPSEQVKEKEVKMTPTITKPAEPIKVEEKVDLIQMLLQASPKRVEQEAKVQEKKPELTRLTPVKLIPRSINATPCHLQFSNGQEYKNMSEHLKSLLKVSA